eukprot:PhF_6_TR18537/c0_g2_i1/m.27072
MDKVSWAPKKYDPRDPKSYRGLDDATQRRRLTISLVVVGIIVAILLTSSALFHDHTHSPLRRKAQRTLLGGTSSKHLQCTCASTIPSVTFEHDALGNVSATIHLDWEDHQIVHPNRPFYVRL